MNPLIAIVGLAAIFLFVAGIIGLIGAFGGSVLLGIITLLVPVMAPVWGIGIIFGLGWVTAVCEWLNFPF